MKLSIIIPVYNVEIYLNQCLLSVCNQDIDSNDYEVIIVNDGSPDRSDLIINDYKNRYPNIKVINQVNQGLSIARNNGLDIASGEYIWFVDSDDWIAANSLSKILKQIQEFHPDIVKIRAIDVFSDGRNKIRHPKYEESRIVSGIEYGINNMGNTPVQFSICKRSFLKVHKLKFFPYIYHEDNEFTPKLFWYAESIAFIDAPIYNYRHNPNSITKIVNPKRAFDLIKVCQSLSKFIVDENIEAKDSSYYMTIQNFICLSFNNALYLIKKTSNENQAEFEKLYLHNLNLMMYFRNSNVLKYNTEYLLWKLYPKPIYWYKILYKFKSIIEKLIRYI